MLQDRPPGVKDIAGWGLEVRGLDWHADTAQKTLSLHRLQRRFIGKVLTHINDNSDKK